MVPYLMVGVEVEEVLLELQPICNLLVPTLVVVVQVDSKLDSTWTEIVLQMAEYLDFC
jgi:hypothetical protein